MTVTQDWRSIVASSLDWEQAHSKLESVVKGLAPSLQGVRPRDIRIRRGNFSSTFG